MTQEEAFEAIEEIVVEALGHSVSISLSTDLVNDGILDSLDTIVFLIRLKEKFDLEISSDVDLSERGVLQVSRLVTLLTEPR